MTKILEWQPVVAALLLCKLMGHKWRWLDCRDESYEIVERESHCERCGAIVFYEKRGAA